MKTLLRFLRLHIFPLLMAVLRPAASGGAGSDQFDEDGQNGSQ